MGLLESANRGTLLLDEIGSMSKQLQGKLLRAMQEGEVVPVGGTERVKVDVRVLAASNRNLWEMVELGEFRRELYYRLNVIEMTIPPLRDRKADIALLTEHFLERYCREQGVEQKALGRPAARKLLGYNWPGNVRELENVIRRAVIVSSGKVIKASDIDLKRAVPADVSGRSDLLSMPYREAKKVIEGEFQKAYLRRMLSELGGSISKVADRAGLSRQAVHEMLRKHGLKKRSSVRGRG
jgi:two-component system response regulator AtoC